MTDADTRTISAGWVKTTVQFLGVSGPKFVKFRDDIGNAFRPVASCEGATVEAPKALSGLGFGEGCCEVVENRWFWVPNFYEASIKKISS